MQQVWHAVMAGVLALACIAFAVWVIVGLAPWWAEIPGVREWWREHAR